MEEPKYEFSNKAVKLTRSERYEDLLLALLPKKWCKPYTPNAFIKKAQRDNCKRKRSVLDNTDIYIMILMVCSSIIT